MRGGCSVRLGGEWEGDVVRGGYSVRETVVRGKRRNIMPMAR